MFKSIALALVVSTLVLAGCSDRGEYKQNSGTDVSLSGNNYQVVKAGAEGSSSGFDLFGFIPIVSPSYADAKANLYHSLGQSLVGRPIALANQTQDRSSLYLILFSIPKLTLSADVVQFDGAATSSGGK